MKRDTLLVVALVAVLSPVLMLCMASSHDDYTSIVPVALASPPSPWIEIGTITSQQDYPGVADRDYTTVAALAPAKTFVWTLPGATRKVQLSFQTTADADSTTVVLMGFAAAKSRDTSDNEIDDDAVYLGQLVLTGGQQVGKHSNVYVDTAVATDGVCNFGVFDSGNNRRCVIEFTAKYKIIIAVATTLQAKSTLYAEGRIY